MRAAIFPAALALLIAATPGAPAQDRSGAAPSGRSTLFEAADPTLEYVEKVAMTDIFLIESSKVALAKGGDQQVKNAAQMILDEHGWLSAQLGQIVEEFEPPPSLPVKLDRPHKKLLAELNRSRRTELDRLYVRLQVKAHEEALAQHTIYAVRGDRPELRSFAESAKPIIQAHLKALRTLYPGN